MSSARTTAARAPAARDTPARGVPPRTRVGRGGRAADVLADVLTDVRLAVSLAVGGVVVGLLVCVGLLALGWVSDPAAGTGWPQALRAGAAAWLLAHVGELGVLGEVAGASAVDPPTPVPGVLSLPPLLLVLLAAWPAWSAGARLAERARPVRALALLPVLAATWAGSAWLLALAADTPAVTPDPLACALGAGLLVLGVSLAAVLRRHAGALLERLPRQVDVVLRRVVPAAGVALVAWLLGGAVLLSAALLLRLSTVADVQTALAPGAGGGAALLLLQLVYVPVAVVWAASVLAGPGAWLAGGHVGPGGSTVVDVPAVPLLGALPDPGAFPLWAFLAPAAVVLAGALAAWHAHRHPSSRGATIGDRAADAVVVAAISGLGALVLGRLSAGSLGPWQPLGPEPFLLAGVVTAEVFAGALLGGGALHLLAGRPLGRWARLRARLSRDGGQVGGAGGRGAVRGHGGGAGDHGRPRLLGRAREAGRPGGTR